MFIKSLPPTPKASSSSCCLCLGILSDILQRHLLEQIILTDHSFKSSFSKQNEAKDHEKTLLGKSLSLLRNL